MKNLKQKIGVLLLGIGLVTGSYFIGHYNPKHITIDKSFIEEFEEMQPGFLNNKKLEMVKWKMGEGLYCLRGLSNNKDTNILFKGNWTGKNPYNMDIKEVWFNRKINEKWTQTIYYAPGELTQKGIEFYKRAKNIDVKEMTLKEKLLWEKLYEELAR